MKNLIKLLLPLTLAATLFTGCGEDPVTCNPACDTGKVCVKKTDDAAATCEKSCTDDASCGENMECKPGAGSTSGSNYCVAKAANNA